MSRNIELIRYKRSARTSVAGAADRSYDDLEARQAPDRPILRGVLMTNEQLVSKVWNYAHVLRDQGISYGDYIEQITYLLFLKMDQEREELLGETSAIPPQWSWAQIANKDGDALELQYRHTLEALAAKTG
jgi:hypothetical protein